jgi:hypothetical protein
MATKRRTALERERAIEVQNTVTQRIYEGIEKNAEDWRRDHLGASLLGHKCDRFLWLSFRWACNPHHDGRQLRLFERGQREEPAIVQNLRDAGMIVLDVHPVSGNQFRVKWGHVGGSADGQISNVPGLDPIERVLAEFKTANGKSFEYLTQKKVRSAKREHFIQMQIYMHGLRLKHALYIVVRKDTDEIYVELVDYDESVAGQFLQRGQTIVDATEPPARMDKDAIPCVYVSKDGTRWPCDFFDLCHGKQMPERNCRTCVSSTPEATKDGKPVWGCGIHDDWLGPNRQRQGCADQQSIPPIVNADVVAVVERQTTYQFADGETKTEEAQTDA